MKVAYCWLLSYLSLPFIGSYSLFITTSIGSNLSHLIEVGQILTTGYTNIHLKQTNIGGKYNFIVTINGTEYSRLENNNTQTFQNVKVYQGDPWHYAAKAFIKNFRIVTTPP